MSVRPSPEPVGTVRIRYGDGELSVPVPAGVLVHTAGRREAAGADSDRLLRHALAHPVDRPPLGEFLRDAKSPLIVVNDATRSTPTALILDALWSTLSETTGWRVIVATGLHRAPTDDEKKVLFGQHAEDVHPRLLIHDGHDNSSLLSLISGKERVLVNRALIEADRIVVLTSVEPHFFAGYTGGRKSLIPGLAGRDTIERSHAGAVSEDAAPLRVRGNPVRKYIHGHTDVFDAGKIWAVHVVLDRLDRIAAAFAGDIDKTFERACTEARKYYAVPLRRQYDVALSAVHPPLDINLYQTEKGWELSQSGVRDNGVLIVTSPCREGAGSAFYVALSQQFPRQEEWLRLAQRPYVLGLHKLVRTGRARKRFRLMAVTDMPPAEVARQGYEPHVSVEAALEEAWRHVGPGASLLVVEDAALTTLTFEQG